MRTEGPHGGASDARISRVNELGSPATRELHSRTTRLFLGRAQPAEVPPEGLGGIDDLDDLDGDLGDLDDLAGLRLAGDLEDRPLLPPELWLLLCSFLQRCDWSRDDAVP